MSARLPLACRWMSATVSNWVISLGWSRLRVAPACRREWMRILLPVVMALDISAAIACDALAVFARCRGDDRRREADGIIFDPKFDSRSHGKGSRRLWCCNDGSLHRHRFQHLVLHATRYPQWRDRGRRVLNIGTDIVHLSGQHDVVPCHLAQRSRRIGADDMKARTRQRAHDMRHDFRCEPGGAIEIRSVIHPARHHDRDFVWRKRIGKRALADFAGRRR